MYNPVLFLIVSLLTMLLYRIFAKAIILTVFDILPVTCSRYISNDKITSKQFLIITYPYYKNTTDLAAINNFV